MLNGYPLEIKFIIIIIIRDEIRVFLISDMHVRNKKSGQCRLADGVTDVGSKPSLKITSDNNDSREVITRDLPPLPAMSNKGVM